MFATINAVALLVMPYLNVLVTGVALEMAIHLLLLMTATIVLLAAGLKPLAWLGDDRL